MSLPIELQEAIQKEFTKKENPFAIFDFDNTCIINDVGEAMFHYLCKNKLLKDFSLLGENNNDADYHEQVFNAYHNLLADGEIKEAYILYAQSFSGFSPEEAEIATRAAIEAEGDTITTVELYGRTIAHGIVLNPATIELFELVKSMGIDVWVVTASVEESVKVAMKYFNLDAKLIGVRPMVKEGKLTKELQMPASIIEGKVDCMRTYISKEAPLMVVDDSMTGIALLETANIKVAVNRGNALTKEAQKRGWFII